MDGIGWRSGAEQGTTRSSLCSVPTYERKQTTQYAQYYKRNRGIMTISESYPN